MAEVALVSIIEDESRWLLQVFRGRVPFRGHSGLGAPVTRQYIEKSHCPALEYEVTTVTTTNQARQRHTFPVLCKVLRWPGCISDSQLCVAESNGKQRCTKGCAALPPCKALSLSRTRTVIPGISVPTMLVPFFPCPKAVMSSPFPHR